MQSILYEVPETFFYTLFTLPNRRVDSDTLLGSPEKAAGVADDKGMSLAARAKNIISSCKTNEDDDSCWHSLTTLSRFPPLLFLPLFPLASCNSERFEIL